MALGLFLTGFERYFAFWSTPIHFGFDAIVLLCIVVLLTEAGAALEAIKTVSPYLLFVAVYVLWGLAVASTPSVIFGQATSILITNGLIALGVAVAIRGRGHLRSLASGAQVAAIATFMVSVYELTNPSLIPQLAFTQNAHAVAFDLARPSGFWSAPNNAGVALVVCFFLSSWSPGWLRWAGRAAAFGGVYLSGSREALYPLVLVAIILCVRHVFRSGPQSGRRQLLRWALPIALITSIALLPTLVTVLGGAHVVDSAATRFLDVTQSSQDLSNPPRLYMLQVWLPQAINGPWYGSGLFTFQGTGALDLLGVHDQYVTIWGETGLLMLVVYAALLVWGIRAAWRLPWRSGDRVLLMLMWLVWIGEGFVTHDAFSEVPTIIFAALVFRLPSTLSADRCAPGLAGQHTESPLPAPHHRTYLARWPGWSAAGPRNRLVTAVPPDLGRG